MALSTPFVMPSWNGSLPRRVGIVIATAVVWGAASVIGHFTSSSSGGLAAIYIPVAILVGLMIRLPRYTVEFALAVVVGNLGVHLATGGALLTSVLFSAITIAEGLLVAGLVARFAQPAFTGPRDGIIFGLSAVGGATLAAVLGAVMAALTGTADPLHKLVTWIPADTLGILLITPLVVTARWRRADLRRVPGFAGLLLLASGLALLAVSWPGLSPWAAFLSWYVVLLVLLLVGVRYGVTALGLVQAAPAVLVFIAVADRAEQEWLLRQGLAIVLVWSLLVAVLAIRSELRSRWSSEQLAQDLFEQAPSPTARVRLTDGNLDVVLANTAWRAFFGQASYSAVFSEIPSEDRRNLIDSLRHGAHSGTQSEIRWDAAGGRVLAVKAVSIVAPTGTPRGLPSDFVVSVEDLTASREREARLQAAAFSDSLTGLANRRAALHDLERRIHRGIPTAVLYLDLDGFKRVNDSYGHAAGDDVLREVARVLTAAFRPDDLVARIGGDEFLVIATMLHASDLASLQHRAETLLPCPLHRGDHRFELGVSAGAVVAQAQQSPEQVIAAADAAMYVRKRLSGRAT